MMEYPLIRVWIQFLFMEYRPYKLEYFSQEQWAGGKIEFVYFGDDRRYTAFLGFPHGSPSMGVFH